MINFKIGNDVITDVVAVTISGTSPHDGQGNPGRGRTTHLLVTVVRSAERTLVPQPVALLTNDDGSAVDCTAQIEFLDPYGIVQHSFTIQAGTMSGWVLEQRLDGSACETAVMTVTQCTYHAGGERAAFEAA